MARLLLRLPWQELYGKQLPLAAGLARRLAEAADSGHFSTTPEPPLRDVAADLALAVLSVYGM
jgi:hypothetical protein